MTTFAIAGTVNRDRIVALDGAVHESLGGILYNAIVLARCAAPGDTIRLYARLGEADRAETLGLLARLPAIDASGLVFVPGGSNEATLTYTAADARTETLIDRVGPLTDDEIIPAGCAEWLLANLISGWDFTPGQIARAAAAGGAHVLLDVQSLALAPPGKDGLRRYRAIDEWLDWCAAVEIVKGNAEEIGWFVERPLAAPDDFAWAAARVLDAGPRALVVTLGARGAFVAWDQRHDGRIVPAVTDVKVADTTGCGDAFAAGFLLEFARSEDPLRATCAGNAVAALVAESRGLAALLDLPKPRELIERLWRQAGIGA